MESLSNIAIVILNYNHYELTINAIENINSFTNDIHIVVVDNNSPNESWTKLNEYCDQHKIKNLSLIKTTENKGYACGNNFGIQYIRENVAVEFVAIMNPDVQIRSIDMFYKMMKILNENKNVGAITAQTIFNNKVYYPNDSCWKFSNRRQLVFCNRIIRKIFRMSDLYKSHSVQKGFAYVDVVQGCFFMTKLSTLNTIGDFDSNTFLYCEEAILAKRLGKAGFKNAILPDYFIEHNHNVKNASLKKRKSIVFDMKCGYKSRKYYIKKYSGYGFFIKELACFSLWLDYILKRIIRILHWK